MNMSVRKIVPVLGAATLLAAGCGGIDKTSNGYREGYSCGKVNGTVNSSSASRLSVEQMVKICSQYATADNRIGDGLKNYRAGVKDGAKQ
jgi:hypothetical protein